jgi:hypothetical protein
MSEGGNEAKIAPSVGIFWGVSEVGRTALVVDATPLSAAEPYGDFLTHPRGHYEMWEAWRPLGPAGLARRGLPPAIAFREYEEFPRGRIVFQTRERLFVIYADRRLQTPAMVARIIATFGLDGERTAVRFDAHYRT